MVSSVEIMSGTGERAAACCDPATMRIAVESSVVRPNLCAAIAPSTVNSRSAPLGPDDTSAQQTDAARRGGTLRHARSVLSRDLGRARAPRLLAHRPRDSEDAAAALVDLVADRLELVPGHVVCDIGCGYGATAQVLAETHDVAVTGITLSAVQHARAARRVAGRGALTFEVRDWLANGFPSASFDRAYAIESTEHMDDKVRCFAEAFRTLRPGGRLVVCAWLANRTPRPWHVRHLLEPICQEGRLPGSAMRRSMRICFAGRVLPCRM